MFVPPALCYTRPISVQMPSLDDRYERWALTNCSARLVVLNAEVTQMDGTGELYLVAWNLHVAFIEGLSGIAYAVQY